MNRKDCLDAAASAVTKNRMDLYGPAENSFGDVADMWEVYLRNKQGPLTAHDVAAMLILLKVVRIKTSPSHADNWVDTSGYGACGCELATSPERKDDAEPERANKRIRQRSTRTVLVKGTKARLGKGVEIAASAVQQTEPGTDSTEVRLSSSKRRAARAV